MSTHEFRAILISTDAKTEKRVSLHRTRRFDRGAKPIPLHDSLAVGCFRLDRNDGNHATGWACLLNKTSSPHHPSTQGYFGN